MKTIGLFIVPRGHRHKRLVQGATQRCRLSGADCALQVWSAGRYSPGMAGLDGILYDETSIDWCRRLLADGKPAINLSSWLVKSSTPRLALDHAHLGVLAAAYLIRRGHAHVSYIGHSSHQGSQQREIAIRKTLVAHGIPFLEAYDVQRSADEEIAYNSLEEQRGIRAWLTALPKPSAVIAFSDKLASLVAEACLKLALRIPADVALLGSDNDDTFTELLPGGLTSIDPGNEILAFEAMGDLLKWIKTGRPPLPDRRIAAGRLIPRGSTDMYYTTHESVLDALDVIHAESTTGLDVKTLAKRLGIHRRTLERLFLRELSSSVHEVIQERRLEEAQRLLVETKYPLKLIAELSGFTDDRHLCVAFRRKLKQRPGFYRCVKL